MRYKRGMQGAELDAYREYRRNLYKKNVEAAGFVYKPGRQQAAFIVYPTINIGTVSDRISARAMQLGMPREQYKDSLQAKQDHEWIITGCVATAQVAPIDSPNKHWDMNAPELVMEELPKRKIDAVREALLQAAKQEELGIATPLLCRAQDAHEPLYVLPTNKEGKNIVEQMFEGVTLETFRQIAMKG